MASFVCSLVIAFGMTKNQNSWPPRETNISGDGFFVLIFDDMAYKTDQRHPVMAAGILVYAYCRATRELVIHNSCISAMLAGC